MDEAADLGIKLAVCTTNKARASLVATLNTLLGEERTAKLDCLLAGAQGGKGGSALLNWAQLCSGRAQPCSGRAQLCSGRAAFYGVPNPLENL